MLVTLAWGVGVGVVIALVDVLASQLSLRITDTDLAAAIELLDLLINLGLCGLAGYRVAAARGELRSGLEAAVLAGLIVGLAGVGYNLARGPEELAAADAVYLVAMNVVLAAGAGALGAWGGSATRLRQPPGSDRGSRRS
ncbi:MAG TPA: hypothetical protein VFE37_09965 [Chloroflexota bacterium]|nr:hypothetical protein [Chloroflexota bacterium]